MQIVARRINSIQHLRRQFCQNNKNLQEKPTEQKSAESKENYNYAKERFDHVNSKSFIEKIQRMELQGKHKTKALESLKFPIILIGSSLFIYNLWQQMPYGVIFRHTTISEYIPRSHFIHAIFLAPLSFQTTGHFLTYWPLLVYGMIVNSQYMRTRHMIMLYVSTSLVYYVFILELCAGVTFAYERYKNSKLNLNMISPKCIGAVTPLSFISAYFAINPNHLIFKKRMFPFLMIPVIFYMYEFQELQAGYVNELCRPAHIAACIWGLVFGFALKKIVLKGII